jgi:hypothetical protein
VFLGAQNCIDSHDLLFLKEIVMKRSFFICGIISTCMFLLTSCQTPNANYAPTAVQSQQQGTAFVCTPEWMKNPKDTPDAIYGTGFAKLRNQALTMDAADGRARRQIVKAIKTKIDARYKDFMQESGFDGDAQSLQFIESISRHISSETLHGCKIIQREFCPDGTIYSLAILPINEVEKIKDITKSKTKEFVVNKKALYNEFKAKKAFDSFQKELDTMSFSEN